MGSKTPENGDNWRQGNSSNSVESKDAGGEPRGSHNVRDGDGCIEDGGSEDEDEDEEPNNDASQSEVISAMADAVSRSDNANAKKKRKKSNKKKKAKKAGASALPLKQSSPPRIALDKFFPSNQFPEGEIMLYGSRDDGTVRTTAAELRHEGLGYWEDASFLSNYRKAAEVHRAARQWIQANAKPGWSVSQVVNELEDIVRALLDNACLNTGDCLTSGFGFPTGICLNNQVAHYTPNPGQKDVFLQPQDVVTIDFGVHINGWIVDSAFTMSFDPTYDELLNAVKEATNAGIKTAGIDVRISDVSAAIQETMESHEVVIGGRTLPIKAVRNLCAHNIKQYKIHGGKSIPFVKNSDQTKMEEGEVFAIETFGTTGRGYIYDDVGVYGYGLNEDAPLNVPLSMSSAKSLHKTIRENFGTINFCRRYLDRLGYERYLAGMQCLVSHGLVEMYKPLMDIKGSYSAQFEHTLILRDTYKEVLSRGDDY